MGALGPAAPWIPEDDLLLKNAIEKGASLESLAKGAVQFSRRYTFRELNERWSSLLYDPIISAEAAAHMIEFERSAPSFSSKLNKLGNSKEIRYSSRKRKTQSVRSCYYALHKRICNKLPEPGDANYLLGPSNGSCVRTVDNSLAGDYILRDPIEFQESDYEIMQHAFPNILMDGVINETTCPGKDVENPTEVFPVEQGDLSTAMPSPLDGDASPMDLLETNNLAVRTSPHFSPINQNEGNICQEVEQTHIFNSPILDCGASFHGLDSPLTDMPIWKVVEDMPMPDDIDLQKDLPMEEDVIIATDMETEDVDQSVYLAELKSLMNLNEEDLLYMDGDGQDMFDKSYYDGLSSLLLNSPADANQDDIADLPRPVVAAVSPKIDVVPDNICEVPDNICEVPDNICKSPNFIREVSDNISKAEECMTSTMSGSASHFSETCDGFIFCALNMEDPDIPCNEDFPNMFAPSSVMETVKSGFQENSDCIPSWGKEVSENPRNLERPPSISSGHHHNLSQPIDRSHLSAKSSLNPAVISDRGIKCEVSNSSSVANLSERIDPFTVALDSHPTLTFKEEPTEISGVKHRSSDSIDCALDRPLNYFDRIHSPLVDAIEEFRDPLESELRSMDPACLELWTEQTESDDNLPLPPFSDVEAMVLSMDLDPLLEVKFSLNEEVNTYSSHEAVLRYSSEAERRKIVRLEQGVRSSTQRDIAFHGAFAILYNGYVKHYIRKGEVLLGRRTDGSNVDIDLMRERCFNKISRRQATIKLERNGSFLLKNLGNKSAVVVNKDIVAPGLSLTLTPPCLIQIRGASYIFDANLSRVKQFLDRTARKQQQQTLGLAYSCEFSLHLCCEEYAKSRLA